MIAFFDMQIAVGDFLWPNMLACHSIGEQSLEVNKELETVDSWNCYSGPKSFFDMQIALGEAVTRTG
tara:strand:+ start:183 stop:383 length:201 start_codon:yes stop_codon:yes gene_type:complete